MCRTVAFLTLIIRIPFSAQKLSLLSSLVEPIRKGIGTQTRRGVEVINQKMPRTTTTVIKSGVLFGYEKLTHVIAAEQLLQEGVEVSAGKKVRFLFTSAEHKRYERRVRAEELIEERTHSDVRKYLLLLYSAASNLLSPFGYSVKDIYDAVRGYQRTQLTAF